MRNRLFGLSELAAWVFCSLAIGFLIGVILSGELTESRWESETVKHNAAVWKTLPDGTVEWSWKEESK